MKPRILFRSCVFQKNCICAMLCEIKKQSFIQEKSVFIQENFFSEYAQLVEGENYLSAKRSKTNHGIP